MLFAELTNIARWRARLHRLLTWGELPVTPPPHAFGLAALDTALHGGLMPGRVALVQGEEGAGKSELCLSLILRAQANRHIVAWLDPSNTFSRARAHACGLDPATLLVSCIDTERALAIATALCERRLADLVVIDPWPPTPVPASMRRALIALGRAAAQTFATVVITRAVAADPPGRYDALRYSSATVIRVTARSAAPHAHRGGLSAGARLASRPASLGFEVVKHPRRRRQIGSPER